MAVTPIKVGQERSPEQTQRLKEGFVQIATEVVLEDGTVASLFAVGLSRDGFEVLGEVEGGVEQRITIELVNGETVVLVLLLFADETVRGVRNKMKMWVETEPAGRA